MVGTQVGKQNRQKYPKQQSLVDNKAGHTETIELRQTERWNAVAWEQADSFYTQGNTRLTRHRCATQKREEQLTRRQETKTHQKTTQTHSTKHKLNLMEP